MSHYEDMIRMYERITQKLNISAITEAYSVMNSLALTDALDIAGRVDLTAFNRAVENFSIQGYARQISEAASRIGQFAEAVYLNSEVANLSGILEKINISSDVIRAYVNLPDGYIKKINESVARLADMEGLDSVMARMSEVMLPQHEVIFHLSEALNSYFADIDIAMPISEDVQLSDNEADIIESIARGEVCEEKIGIEDHNIREKIAAVIFTILLGLVTNFLTHIIEPVYRSINPMKLLMDSKDGAEAVAEIPKDAELTVWSNDVSQDYIEISYTEDGVYYQGYIGKKDIIENTIQISEGHQLDELLFTNSCIEIMADYWEIEPEEVYRRLNYESNLMDNYIIPNYAVLSRMEDEDLAKEIEEHFNSAVESNVLDIEEQE